MCGCPTSCYSNIIDSSVLRQCHLMHIIITDLSCCVHIIWYRSISHSVLSTVHCSPLQFGVPQTVLQRFGVAAVRGVARNRGIAEFHLEPWRREQNVVDDILAQLTPGERRKFKVGKDERDCPSIELCPVGERTTFSLLMQCVCSMSVSQLRGPVLSLVRASCITCRWWRADDAWCC